MRSRLEHSMAELCKLKNQIRMELNRVRPRGEPPSCIQQEDRPSKKIFGRKYKETSFIEPREEQQKEGSQQRRHYDELVGSQEKRSVQRRHYGRQYTDSVQMGIQVRRRSSSYLNVRREASPAQAKSLMGIGQHDKSLGDTNRGIRIDRSKLIFKADLI